jgi:hypothetical protein
MSCPGPPGVSCTESAEEPLIGPKIAALNEPSVRPDHLGKVGILLAKSERVPAGARVSCRSLRQRAGSGRLRATWQGSKGEAVAFGMPVSGQLGEFANGIGTF